MTGNDRVKRMLARRDILQKELLATRYLRNEPNADLGMVVVACILIGTGLGAMITWLLH